MKEADTLREEVEQLKAKIGELETQVADGDTATKKAEAAAEAATAKADAMAQAAGECASRRGRWPLCLRLPAAESTLGGVGSSCALCWRSLAKITSSCVELCFVFAGVVSRDVSID